MYIYSFSIYIESRYNLRGGSMRSPLNTTAVVNRHALVLILMIKFFSKYYEALQKCF